MISRCSCVGRSVKVVGRSAWFKTPRVQPIPAVMAA